MTEAEYIYITIITRFFAMRTIIQELSEVCALFSFDAITQSMVCEDKKGCVHLIAALAICLWARHIAIEYHYFHEDFKNGNTLIKWILTHDQLQIFHVASSIAQIYKSKGRYKL